MDVTVTLPSEQWRDIRNALLFVATNTPYEADYGTDYKEAAKTITATVQAADAPFYTIQDSDVGKPRITAWQQEWAVSNFMGQILPRDVGKRVFRVGSSPGFLQVENDVQRDKRERGTA